MTIPSKRVAIIHPWFPQYREPFFRLLVEHAAQVNIAIDIYHGDPPPEWGERGDSVRASYAKRLPTKFFRLGGRNLAYKKLSGEVPLGDYDLVIVEQAVRNLETYLLLVRSKRIAFWGHGRTYTLSVGSAQESLKKWLTRRGSWFFGYTASGVDAVVGTGFPAERTTVVANSVDTTALAEGLRAVGDEQLREFRERYDISEQTAVFIGGLDEAKRVDFLLEAAERAAEMNPRFRLIIAGGGAQQDLVTKAAEARPHVIYLGPVFGMEKYVALKAGRVIAMPGRVGLVAVDSLAAGIPLVTTDWPFHAPEYEYLSPGVDCVVAPNDVGAYASALVSTLNNPGLLDRLSSNALKASSKYSIEAMVANFLTGVADALASDASN